MTNRCPRCGAILPVPRTGAGGACPSCGALAGIEVPRPAASLDQESISIVPEAELPLAVQATLEMEPGGFRPESHIEDPRELRADYERLRAAYLFHRYAGGEDHPPALLENLLRLAFELLPADRGAVLLREEAGAPLIPAAARERGPGRVSLAIPERILRAAVEGRRAVLSTDATADARFQGSESILRANVRSAMCVPLVGFREVLGVIHLDTREQTGAFTAKDLSLLSVLASQAALALDRLWLRRQVEQEARLRERLSRFFPPPVLSEVIERGLDLAREGRTVPVSVLFCDIRGFTALAERLPPRELLRLLNAHFERLVAVVFRHAGVLDKFIGDALMAVWGAPIRRSDDARRALSAGLEMLVAVREFNRARPPEWPELQVGIGINSGEAVVGTVGSALRMEYTVMGDAVNLAERLCAMAAPGQILLSKQTLLQCAAPGRAAPRVRSLSELPVRGRSDPVEVFECLDLP